MQSNKFKGAAIYLIIILVLVFGMIFVLNNMIPRTSGEYTVVRPSTYSDVLNDFDSFTVSEYTLDLGSGALNYKKSTEE